MAQGISPDTIEYVRSQADIVQVVSEYVTLTKAGSNFKACCPFHQEKTPSFVVSPGKQLYHCFGCGAGGNVFGFLMRQEGLTFGEAVKLLAGRLGIQVREESRAPEKERLKESLFGLYDFATRFYHGALLNSPDAENARNYLKKRNLAGNAVKEFSLGYAPAGWDSFLCAAKKKGFSEELLLTGGLVKKNSEGGLYDAFRNRVMFPIHGLTGKVIAFGGRTLEENQPKYINSPETPIYQKGQTLYNLNRAKKNLSNNDPVIVVEGYTDVIRLVLNGIDNVVASLGTAFTQSQARLLKRYTTDVVFVFDFDSAGKAATGRGIDVLLAQDLGVKFVFLPSGKDPDEFVQAQGEQSFRALVDKAMTFVDFYVERDRAGWDENEIESKVKTANTLASLVAKIPDPIRREEYFRLAASRLKIRPEILLQASQKSGFTDKIEVEARRVENQLRHDERKCMWLIRMLFERPEHRGIVRENLDFTIIRNDALKKILETILDDNADITNENALFDRIQDEDTQRMFSRLVFDKAGPETFYPVEWWTAFIASHQKKEALANVLKEIREAEKANNHELLTELYRRKTELNRGLKNIKEQMKEIPVYGDVENKDDKLASAIAEIREREMRRAERAGDAKLVNEWKKRNAAECSG